MKCQRKKMNCQITVMKNKQELCSTLILFKLNHNESLLTINSCFLINLLFFTIFCKCEGNEKILGTASSFKKCRVLDLYESLVKCSPHKREALVGFQDTLLIAINHFCRSSGFLRGNL